MCYAQIICVCLCKYIWMITCVHVGEKEEASWRHEPLPPVVHHDGSVGDVEPVHG